MNNTAFCNCDGEMLIVIQEGKIRITSELGLLDLEPNYIGVIPRGMKYKVDLLDNCKFVRG